jgi:hypothetical protein
MKQSHLVVCCCVLSALAGSNAVAKDWAVVQEDSIFAVLTHKAGLGSSLAHNHLIYPKAYSTSLSSEDDELESVSFKLEFPVDNLTVDDPDMQKKWQPRINPYKLANSKLSPVRPSDRNSITESMLGPEQLDAETYPTISAELVVIEEAKTTVGNMRFSRQALVRVTIHGQTVERKVPIDIIWEEDRMFVQALGAFTFTEFGITPYSAMLGAVKNQDQFHIFVHLEAVPAAE